ncbi:MAG TPA: lipopolysaccharide biosynthesis protein, partial [Methylomirabilota bacterium]|nr:lipopolysaccharide biosynthesis protein [Methylomirabilota bacterium]
MEGGGKLDGSLQPGPGIKRRTIRGAGVLLMSQAVRVGLNGVVTVVLARLLTPADFGLVAMVTTITGFAALFKDAGLSMVTIQRERMSDAQVTALFWVNVAVSVTLMLVLMAAAPWVVKAYGEPRLQGITLALASVFVLGGLNAQHFALLRRQMRFAAVAAVELGALVVGGVVGIALAAAGKGYWALVGMSAAVAVVTTAGAWVASGWSPGWPRRGVGLRSMLRFGGTMLGLEMLHYVSGQADNFLIGRRWGDAALGFYGKAFRMLDLMTGQLNGVFRSVAVPALSRLQTQPEQRRRHFLNGYSIVVALSILIISCSAVYAPEAVAVVLGPQWESVGPLFRLLAPGAVAAALMNSQGWLALACGRVGQQLRLALWVVPLTVLAFVVGLPWGPSGVAMAYSVAKVSIVWPVTAVMTRGTGVSVADVFRAARPALIAGTVAAGLGWLLRAVLERHLGPFAVLAIGGATMTGLYLGLL